MKSVGRIQGGSKRIGPIRHSATIFELLDADYWTLNAWPSGAAAAVGGPLGRLQLMQSVTSQAKCVQEAVTADEMAGTDDHELVLGALEHALDLG